jgi:hypothetical protein
LANFSDYDDITVNHIDGDTENNAAANLEWATGRENTQHAAANNLFKGNIAVKQHVLNKDGTKGDLIGSYGTIKAASEAAHQAVKTISDCVHGKRAQCKYFWVMNDENETD